ncbi:MAG: hypothetical protein LBF97_04170, partial [Elusimicrobiota bacterium]|nr:hypothetical protein [Elusimicrobiota bacterium]
KKLKILSIKENKKTISINFLSSTNVNFDKLLNFIQKYKNNLKFRANNTNIIEILNLPEDKEKKLNFIKNFLENISV